MCRAYIRLPYTVLFVSMLFLEISDFSVSERALPNGGVCPTVLSRRFVASVPIFLYLWHLWFIQKRNAPKILSLCKHLDSLYQVSCDLGQNWSRYSRGGWISGIIFFWWPIVLKMLLLQQLTNTAFHGFFQRIPRQAFRFIISPPFTTFHHPEMSSHEASAESVDPSGRDGALVEASSSTFAPQYRLYKRRYLGVIGLVRLLHLLHRSHRRIWIAVRIKCCHRHGLAMVRSDHE